MRLPETATRPRSLGVAVSLGSGTATQFLNSFFK